MTKGATNSKIQILYKNPTTKKIQMHFQRHIERCKNTNILSIVCKWREESNI